MQQHIAVEHLSTAMDKIDVSRFVRDMESALRTNAGARRRGEILATCERWQYDEQIDDSSRLSVRRLLREFRGF